MINKNEFNRVVSEFVYITLSHYVCIIFNPHSIGIIVDIIIYTAVTSACITTHVYKIVILEKEAVSFICVGLYKYPPINFHYIIFKNNFPISRTGTEKCPANCTIRRTANYTGVFNCQIVTP